MTKFCPFCGEKLVDNAKFCKNCGKSLENYQNQSEGSTSDTSYPAPVTENTHTVAVVLGFICSVLIPLFGLIFGVYIYTRDDYSNAKKIGGLIIAISVIVWIISFIMIT